MGTLRPLGRTGYIGGILLCAATLLFAFTGQAFAGSNLCVGTTDAANCIAKADLATAIADSVNGDTIYLGPGDYPGSFDLTNRVLLKGVGSSKPVIQPSGVTPGLTVTNALASVDNIAIELPAVDDAVGLLVPGGGGAQVSNIDVSGGSTGATGISLAAQSSGVSGASIDLPGSGSTAVSIAGATGVSVDDVRVDTAATAVGLSNAQNFKVRRMIARSSWGVSGTNSSGTASSSVFATTLDSSGMGVSIAVASPQTVRLDNCTFIGTPGSSGLGVSVAGAVDLTLNSNVIYGYTTPVSTAGVTLTKKNNIETSTDPGFVNVAGGDYRPTPLSQMVDAGDPSPLDASDSGTDAAGNPRVASRGGGQVRDIGAYEAQNSPPSPMITVRSAVPSTTAATVFSATASTDPDGDAMTYSWKFDGTVFASGAEVQRLFIADGPHAVELTATDVTGASATTSSQFIVQRGTLALKLRSQSARMSKHGTFSITMTCPAIAASNCTGRLIFATTKKIEAKRYQDPSVRGKSSKAKILRAANYAFSVEPGVTRKLTVRTYGTFQNVLAVHKKFVLQSTLVSGSTSNATLVSNRTTFTLSAPKKRKK
jgi:hypothetical protein